MKTKLLTIGFTTILVSILMSSLAYASWSTLGTGYAVTSNMEGNEVESGTPLTIMAGTLDLTVKTVTFRWLAPPNGSGDCVLEETVTVNINGTIGYWDNGKPGRLRYAESTYVVFYQGEWKVEVIFHTSEGQTSIGYPIYVKGDQEIFSTPEMPLGTIGATVAMAAALGLFMIKRKRQQK
jgi:hypothetical protein